MQTPLLAIGFKAQDFSAFQFYDKSGKVVKTDKMIKSLLGYDVVLFGENHNNSINHWLQLRLTEALFEKNKNLILGAEMFERDNQSGLNQYLAGKLEVKNLKDSVRLWNNFTTDYQPLVDFAKSNKLEFIATNIPRKFASQVSKQGLESLNQLPDSDKKDIAKLPINVTLETPGYKEMKAMMGDHADDMKVMNFVSAQAVKDATMAESILKSWKSGKLFLHYNGNYHSKEYGGIYWYLKKANPSLKVAVITVVESESKDLAFPEKDYIPTEFNLILPSDMTKTY
ncbi:ChaN family lipoprotein [Soonwooa sp.]|uniref:ChaN family lipoprotein n=1 Tax=Soonwooa sp. TaxID=1938592 RepID=UPI0026039448|nr:ChaN family lipoprotein [Soonwooa sp.]